jgi:hypothetical protein
VLLPPPQATPQQIIADVLAKVSHWPTRDELLALLDQTVVLAPNNKHAGIADEVPRAPEDPTQPMMALRSIRENTPVVMSGFSLAVLGPSGCGKTDVVVRYIAQNGGVFLSWRETLDEKMGSWALTAVLKSVTSAWRMLPERDEERVAALTRRRDDVAYGVHCVLTAYDAVFNAMPWMREAHADNNRAWLMAMLFPEQAFAGPDVFLLVATVLQRSMTGREKLPRLHNRVASLWTRPRRSSRWISRSLARTTCLSARC